MWYIESTQSMQGTVSMSQSLSEISELSDDCVHVCMFSHSVVSDSLQHHGLQPARLLCPWDFSGKNTGVGCHFLLQGIFPTQGSNLGFLHCRHILYHLSHQGSPFLIIFFYEQYNYCCQPQTAGPRFIISEYV